MTKKNAELLLLTIFVFSGYLLSIAIDEAFAAAAEKTAQLRYQKNPVFQKPNSNREWNVGYEEQATETKIADRFKDFEHRKEPETRYELDREAINAKKSDYEGRLECKNNVIEHSKCDSAYWYRKPDGTCNNLKQTWYGASKTPFKRMRRPKFQDGESTARSGGVDGTELPSSRHIANKIHFPSSSNSEQADKDITLLLPVFGQFVMHDLTRTAHTLGPDGNVKKCVCDSKSPDCISISIPKDDKRFKGQQCLIMVREADARESFDCGLKYRTPLNLINSWLDNSNIYGNNKDEEIELRSFNGGKLKVTHYMGSAGQLLTSNCPMNAINLMKRDGICFKSGDDRVNQIPTLTAMHTLWVKEHNRIAGELWKLNPTWNDERLYQETKRIVNGIYQNIVYWEWLPLVIGKEMVEIFDLKQQSNDEYFYGYDEKIFPNVAVEFATAAGRFAHSIMRPKISKADKYYNIIGNYTLKDVMYNPKLLIPDRSFDQLLLGTIAETCDQNMPHFNEELSSWLVQDLGRNNPSYFFSLPAINIERGRDCGLAPYIYYREKAGLRIPTSFEELTWISPKHIELLKKVYKSVYDIDLFTGGLIENHVKGGLVGPTFAYIIARGFRDWKYADRWFYENPQGITPLAFTNEQLNSLRKTKLSSLFCNNLDIAEVPVNVFLKPHPKTNPFIPCSKVWQLKLNSFTDKIDSSSYFKQPKSYISDFIEPIPIIAKPVPVSPPIVQMTQPAPVYNFYKILIDDSETKSPSENKIARRRLQYDKIQPKTEQEQKSSLVSAPPTSWISAQPSSLVSAPPTSWISAQPSSLVSAPQSSWGTKISPESPPPSSGSESLSSWGTKTGPESPPSSGISPPPSSGSESLSSWGTKISPESPPPSSGSESLSSWGTKTGPESPPSSGISPPPSSGSESLSSWGTKTGPESPPSSSGIAPPPSSGSESPPSSGISPPPSSGSESPSSWGTKISPESPPSLSGSAQPPSSGSEPPSSWGTKTGPESPPSSSGIAPPSSLVSEPPFSWVSAPPSSWVSEPPSLSGIAPTPVYSSSKKPPSPLDSYPHLPACPPLVIPLQPSFNYYPNDINNNNNINQYQYQYQYKL